MKSSSHFRIGAGSLLLLIAAFGIAAAYASLATYQRQKALERSSRYDVAFSASQAVHELVRLNQRITGVLNPMAAVPPDEIALRYAILLNRLSLMEAGEFHQFLAADIDRQNIIAKLRRALTYAADLIPTVQRPDANERLLDLLLPLEPDLIGLAAAANEYGGERIFDDQKKLLRLHWIFTGLAGGLTGTGLLLTGLLVWTNRCLMHQERALKLENHRFDAALSNMGQGLCMLDGNNKLIVANQRFFQLFGLPTSEATQTCDPRTVSLHIPDKKVPGDGRDAVFLATNSSRTLTLADQTVLQVVQRPMANDGRLITYEDITERVAADNRIQYLARHDNLTGLANRVVLTEALERAFSRLQRRTERFAVLCLDLDGFKGVNDTLGHPAGDLLLKEVAKRLQLSLRDQDLAARVGGDEFIIVQDGIASSDDAERFAQRILEAMGRPFILDGQQAMVSASIGIALAPENGLDPEELLQHADAALYRAKQYGKDTYKFFEHQLQAALVRRRELEQDLRLASFDDDFELEYQVQVCTSTLRVVGAEALLRWRNPRCGLLSPSDFMELTEETGIIVALGEWALRKACLEAAKWPSQVRLAVNVSPIQFQRGNIIDVVSQALTESQLAADRLELEITESVVLVDTEKVLRNLEALRSGGITIALDDFGTGYSALSHLTRFPIGRVKVDKSFIRDFVRDRKKLEIVRAISGLCETLDLSMVAEGVENWAEFELLQAVHCAEAQGYLFGMPQSAQQIQQTFRTKFTRSVLRRVAAGPPARAVAAS